MPDNSPFIKLTFLSGSLLVLPTSTTCTCAGACRHCVVLIEYTNLVGSSRSRAQAQVIPHSAWLAVVLPVLYVSHSAVAWCCILCRGMRHNLRPRTALVAIWVIVHLYDPAVHAIGQTICQFQMIDQSMWFLNPSEHQSLWLRHWPHMSLMRLNKL